VPGSPDRVLFGAAYYFEYGPADRLEVDLDLMRDAHVSVIRVGESVWSTWEPDDGVFDLDWLQPVLDGAQARGISVILGTPTYAIPMWLARRYPEIAGERATGERIGWGARQEVDYTHAAFRFHAERVVRAIMGRHAAHPAVIGYQVDNEPGLVLYHNEGVFQRFVDALRRSYGDVQTLNDRWGLVYWSHRLTSWADLWRPDGNVQPQYDLAWRRFQADETTDFIDWQARIVREYARPDQFVTTCLAYDRPAVDDEALGRRLDVLGGNPYYVMQDALTLPAPASDGTGWKIHGVWALFQAADRMYASRQAPFLVTETNATSIGEAWDNRPAFDGQWRQAAWALIARGARMIEYWHWNTLRFGGETYWGGVLPHSGRAGRTYREVAALGAELEAAGTLITELRPQSDLTMLLSLPSKWLMQEHPPLATAAGGPDPDSYRGLFDPFYRGAFEAGCQVRIMHVDQLVQSGGAPGGSLGEIVREHPLLVVPGLYVAEDATLRWLADYAAAGGHLILGPRTAYGDDEARARVDVAPAYLAAAAGVWYEEFSNLVDEVPVIPAPGSADLPLSAHATRWIDGLTLQGAEWLASYQHPHFGRWPAITTHSHGAGRVTMVGTVPNRDLARALFTNLVPRPVSGWESLPPSVTAATAVTRDGRRLHVLHNWSWDAADVTAPADLQGVGSQPAYLAGARIRLDSRDVQVFVEEVSGMRAGDDAARGRVGIPNGLASA
jgi:beta-galactosidase